MNTEEMGEVPTGSEMVPADDVAPDVDAGSASPETMAFDDLPDPPGLESPQQGRRAGGKPGSLEAVLGVRVKVLAVLGRSCWPSASLV